MARISAGAAKPAQAADQAEDKRIDARPQSRRACSRSRHGDAGSGEAAAPEVGHALGREPRASDWLTRSFRSHLVRGLRADDGQKPDLRDETTNGYSVKIWT